MAQTINVDSKPALFMPTLYYSQGDVGRTFEIVVSSSDGFTIPSGATCQMVATKPSGLGFTVAGTVSGNKVTFTTTAVMTDEWGRFPAELRITSGNTVIGTANFYMEGERNPHPDGTTDGQQEQLIPELTLLVERAENAAQTATDDAIEAASATIDEVLNYLPTEVTNLKSEISDINDRFTIPTAFKFTDSAYDSIIANLPYYVSIYKRIDRQFGIATTDASAASFYLPLNIDVGVEYEAVMTWTGTTGVVGDNPNIRVYNGDTLIGELNSNSPIYIRKSSANDDYKVRFYLSKSSTIDISDVEIRQAGVEDTLKVENLPTLNIPPEETTFFDFKSIFEFTDDAYDSVFANTPYYGHFTLRERTKLTAYTDDIGSIQLTFPLDLEVGKNYALNFTFSTEAGYVGDNPNIRVYKNDGAMYQLESGITQIVQRESETDTISIKIYVARKARIAISDCDIRIVGDKDTIKEEYLPANLPMVYSVKDFGAVCDGIADDSDAIQLAIDSIPTGSTLLIGRCKLTKPLHISKILKLKGSSVLHGNYTGSYYASQLYFTEDWNITDYCIYTTAPIVIEDLIIHCYNTPANAFLINAYHVAVMLKNCVLQGGNGLIADHSYYCKIEDCFFVNSSIGVDLTNCYNFCCLNTAFQANSKNFVVKGGSVTNLQNCSFEAYEVGAEVDSNSAFNADMCYFEPGNAELAKAIVVTSGGTAIISRSHAYLTNGYFVYASGSGVRVVSENNKFVYQNLVGVYYIDSTGATVHISGDNWDTSISDNKYAVLNSSTGDIEIKYPYGNSNYS